VASTAGAFRSSDRGLHWTDITGPLNTGPLNTGPLYDVTQMVVDPTDSRIAYAIRQIQFDRDGSANQPPHVFRTRDGGANWQALSSGFPDKYPFVRPNALLMDPRNPDVLYLGSDCEKDGWCVAGGVYKSTNAGDTWVKLSGPTWPYALSLDPGSPDTLYISDSIRGYGRSDDGGGTWLLDQKTPFPSRQVLPDPTDARRRYGIENGFFITTDEGRTWQPAEVRLLSGETIGLGHAVLAADPAIGRVFLGVSSSSSYGGLFRTAAGASRWAKIGGIANQPITAVVFDAASQALMIGTPSGLYRSLNLGGEWTELEFARGAAITRVVPHVAQRGMLYALGLNLLFRTNDHGQSWTVAASPLPFEADGDIPTELAVDAGGDVYVTLRSHHVLKHSSGSDGWSSLQVRPTVPVPLLAFSLVADPAIPGTLYALSGTFLGPSMAMTRDGGVTWVGVETPTDFTSLQPHPSRSGRLLASSRDAVWRSDDAGVSWTPVLRDVVAASDIITSKADPELLSLLTRDGSGRTATYRVYRSTDGGSTWTAVQPRLADGSLVAFSPADHTLVADPRDSRTLYALTTTEVIRSDDAGATWRSVSAGLAFLPLSMAIDDGFVHVTTDRGVWELPLEIRRRAVRHQ
jgi:photosystem II stability/assembly factor-like uncharacterized protein